ncbi:hypothetical protein QKU48_gp0262 [Fadolivirus algeromassiliense]|jgi:hypothetical protein|uniref:Zinc-ribbon domain-containing protein n=1 Tax=Fadolivirus FV1/VV64 TaxID=3070911 RepID=A0A7D3QWM9_9VIRU|nr:hypothetical protein QKU48_gp0262 [Fadolivirus algeromassiliense]QKF93720.1 hypothetical protein Fadolivirus_1_262 [Fadolivirus FV1/VV64]
MIWKCKNNHIFINTYARVQRGFWCSHPDCNFYNIQFLKDIASKKGGKCLSTKFVGMTSKYLWECACGNQWYAFANSINKKNGTWCPKCNGTTKLTIEDGKKLAENRGGKCLSAEYISYSTKLKWECEFGHIWEATYQSINKHWCTECSKSISYNERLSRELLNKMFNKNFINIKPTWLINQETNKLLEIDMYCDNLKLGFEYQGKQHYEFCKRFHKTHENFIKQQNRDKLKFTLCNNHGITLLYIPYYIKPNNLQKYIIDLCEKNEINIPHKEHIDIKAINIFKSRYVKLFNNIKEISTNKRGECLSTTYTPDIPMKFKCEFNHIWETKPRNIETGSWCLECYKTRQKGHTIESINKNIEEYNCECISDKYTNNCSKLKWKCNKCNFIWECDLSSMLKRKKKGYFCSKCYFV